MDIPPTDVAVGKVPIPPEGYEIARVDVVVHLPVSQDYQLCADELKKTKAASRPPFPQLVARFDDACLVAEFVGIPATDDYLYLRCDHFVGWSWPGRVSWLPKPHLFLQLR